VTGSETVNKWAFSDVSPSHGVRNYSSPSRRKVIQTGVAGISAGTFAIKFHFQLAALESSKSSRFAEFHLACRCFQLEGMHSSRDETFI